LLTTALYPTAIRPGSAAPEAAELILRSVAG
jgi:hypothetical protein